MLLELGSKNYPSGDTCGFPDFFGSDGQGRDINVPEPPAPPVVSNWSISSISQNCPLTGSWTTCVAPTLSFPGDRDAVDVRVNLYAFAESSPGFYVASRADRVTATVDFDSSPTPRS